MKFDRLEDGTYAVSKQNNDLAGEVIIPTTYNGVLVTTIADHAFVNCNGITSVTVPSTIITIGNCAFRECANSTWVEMPFGVITIGDYAFAGTGIEEFIIPSSVTTVGAGAFLGCGSLTDVILARTAKNGITIIDTTAFAGCDNLWGLRVFDEDSYYAYYNYFSINQSTDLANMLVFIMYI